MYLGKSMFLLSLSLLLLTGCSSSKKDEKMISVTIEPQHYLLYNIVGDKYTINTLMTSGTDPENADFPPSKLKYISNSKIYFTIGLLPTERTWVKNIESLNTGTKFINCSSHIKLLTDDDHHGQNPHIWNSPTTVRSMAQIMFDTLIKTYPQDKAYFTTNYQNLLIKINTTDSIIKKNLSESTNKSFIIFHPSLSYFAREYGLNQYAIEKEGKNPSPKALKQIIDIAKKEHIKILFIEEEYDKKNAETIADAIGGKIVNINLFDYNWDTEMIKISEGLR